MLCGARRTRKFDGAAHFEHCKELLIMLTPATNGNANVVSDSTKLLPVSAFVEPIMRWSRVWEVPYLHTSLRIRYSDRMRKNSGLCRSVSGEIVLNAQYLRYQP